MNCVIVQAYVRIRQTDTLDFFFIWYQCHWSAQCILQIKKEMLKQDITCIKEYKRTEKWLDFFLYF